MTAQSVAVKALADATGVWVSTRLPADRPEKHIVVSRIGGVSPEFGTDMPRYLVEIYAGSEFEAERFAEKVHAVWLRLRSHGINSSTSDYNLVRFDSPDVDHVRFQFTGGLQITADPLL